MTRGGDVSFGQWRIVDIPLASVVEKDDVVGIRLSLTDLVLIDQSGRTLATWPVNQVVLNVFGDIDAQIRLGSSSTWIRSIEGDQRVSCLTQSRHEETSNQRHNPHS